MHQTEDFIYRDKFELESGAYLPGFQLRFTTYGKLNKARDNVIWGCHALTANANFMDWWRGLFGKGKLYDPDEYYIICANILGSCYGSTGPLSVNPETAEPFYHDFPLLTNRDMVRAFDSLRAYLGIERIHTVIGGSLGGQHALEWAIMHPDRIQHLVQLCSNAQHSPWGIAFNESQRMAIESDPSWPERRADAGLQGMRTAPSRSYLTGITKLTRTPSPKLPLANWMAFAPLLTSSTRAISLHGVSMPFLTAFFPRLWIRTMLGETGVPSYMHWSAYRHIRYSWASLPTSFFRSANRSLAPNMWTAPSWQSLTQTTATMVF